MSLSKLPTLAQSVERVQQAREALQKGCWHMLYSKHKNACQAAKALAAFACLSTASGPSFYNTSSGLKTYFHEDFHIFRLERFVS
jgi:hypothetical protein